MSSFIKHCDNIKELKGMGFDIDIYTDVEGADEYESWNSDVLVELLSDVIFALKRETTRDKWPALAVRTGQ